jgi:hypothetical protein
MPLRFGNVVMPVYVEDGGGRPKHEGTAVLLQSQDGLWLFTAAHVLATHIRAPIILPGKKFFRLQAQVFASSKLTPEETEKDSADVAFVRLTNEQAESLYEAGFHFLPITRESIDRSEVPPFPATCAVTGFNVDSVEIDHVKEVAMAGQMCLLSRFIDPRKLGSVQRSPTRNLGVEYPGRPFIDGKRARRPDPRGLSGGAIWKIDGKDVRLAGIVIECYASRSMIVGTRLESILEAISHF